jgi:hypothetical protein
MQSELKNVIYITVLPFEYRCIRVVKVKVKVNPQQAKVA